MQDVLPPSIHPDTGKPYVWVLGDLASFNAIPEVPASIRAIVDAMQDGTPGEGEKGQLGMSREELRGHLARRDPDCTYDEWLSAGMALHHESRGAVWGLSLWDEWSSRGRKYQSFEDLETRWSGFRTDEADPITARWLLQGDVATAEEFPDESKTPEGKPKPGKFRFEHSSLVPVFKPLEWLIRDVLPDADLGVLYGEPGAGKSFMALDMAMAVATGRTWRDKVATPGAVAYVCAEGAAGFRRRYAAYLGANGLDASAIPFWFLDGAPNLHGSDHLELVSALRADNIAPRLVVIDTLARTMGGADENSGEDMGAYIAHAGRLAELTDAMVLIVHHSGKDASRGARGHSSLRGAVDVELEVSASGGAWRTLAVTKQKDGEQLEPMQFKLRTVLMGMADDGTEITSCVVEHGASGGAERTPDRNRFAAQVLSAIDECMAVDTGVANVEDVIVATMRHFVHDASAGRDKRRQHALQALNRFALQGKILINGDEIRRPS